MLKEFKSIQTLHDELINIINLMKFGCENKIDYKGETRRVFESNFLPDYKFELAESDLQIYQVGHKFNNCLGGYVDEAMEQRVFIIFLRNKVTEEIEYAMEVSPNKVLYQAEGKYNQLPPENVWEIIKKYCDEKGIRIPKERAA
ncbi:PcfJ domain-containing protein [Bacillus halotolerans]|uniref:PcfJ domain-containing protein n=1 Tax=Bacillus halotolerans TaxID=260554 RepID=UPI00404B8EE5